jgi:hypothetical protein
MCDYSLEHVASRPAVVGDKLVTRRLGNSVTRGFAALTEPTVAVCLLPGTEIAFEHEVQCAPTLGLFRSRSLGHKVARFRQVNKDRPGTHHDALEFPDGEIVLLTHLREGQPATVLQLPVAAANINEPEQARSAPISAVVRHQAP